MAVVAASKRWPPAPWKPHEHVEAGWGWLVGDGPDDDSAAEDRSFCGFGDGDYDADLAEYVAQLVEAPADIAALLAELEVTVPHTRDTATEPDAEVLAASVTCDCCTTQIPAGESAVMFVDETGRKCWAHYGRCPEPEMWLIEYMPRSSRRRDWIRVCDGATGEDLMLPYDDALARARGFHCRVRLVRVRKEDDHGRR